MNAMTFTHPTQPKLFVRVILASVCAETGKRVYTLHLSYPRIIHGEFMTHRVFNRNARSSRAVPIATMIEEIRANPFIPWHKTRNQKGMQGVDGWNADIDLWGDRVSFEEAWLSGLDGAIDIAMAMSQAEYHKQIGNRLLEPWMWIDTLVTSSQWENFLHLRDHADAEPHMRDLAVLVGLALAQAELQTLKPGEWHLPYITQEDRDWVRAESDCDPVELLCHISAARCARISYAPFDGDASYQREMERYAQLVGGNAIHASPLEHQCTPDTMSRYDTILVDGDKEELVASGLCYDNPSLHASLHGFIQARKLVPNEAING